MSENLGNWYATRHLVLVVMGGKGGIGKSLTAQLLAAALRAHMLKVLIVDTDHTNSSSRSVDPTAQMVRLAAPEARGYIDVHLDSLTTGNVDALVMDTGAQEDGLVRNILSWLADKSRNAGAVLVPVLPLTLSSHNQARSVAVAQHAQQVGAPVLFVRNLGQGRSATDYDRWDGTKTRKAVLEAGAVEVVLPDLGARWTDEAAGFGLSLADAAKGNFAKIVEEAQASGADLNKAQARAKSASEVFDPGVRAWLSIYLGEVGDTLLTGIKDAVDLRHRLDAKR